MTGYEDEAQQVVTDFIVHGRLKIRPGQVLPGLHLIAEFLVFAIEHGIPAQQIDGAMFRRSHKPGSGLVGNARLRPLLERGHQSVLREILGNADVPHDPREARDEPRRLDSPDCVDGAMGIGRRHSFRLQHRRPPGASRGWLRLRRTVGGEAGQRAKLTTNVRRAVNLANLGLTVACHGKEALGKLDRLLFRLRLDQREATNNFLRLGEGAVGHGKLSS